MTSMESEKKHFPATSGFIHNLASAFLENLEYFESKKFYRNVSCDSSTESSAILRTFGDIGASDDMETFRKKF
jgi:hypothetical protein